MARKAAARLGTTRRGAAGSASEEEIIVSNSDTRKSAACWAADLPFSFRNASTWQGFGRSFPSQTPDTPAGAAR